MISDLSRPEVIQTIQTKIDIEAIVKGQLPMMPGSSARVADLLSDINVSSRKLTDAVSYDPILTMRILRLANSAIYSMQKGVTTLRQAIDVVGMNAIYEILITGLAADSFAKEIRNSMRGRKIWEHSIAVALLSRDLSQIMGLRGTEEAFICGLLHDIGKILLLREDLKVFFKQRETQTEYEMLRSESEIFGYNHAQIGSLVANRWKLPDGVCHTILNHHNPSQSEQFLVVAHLIGVADAIANAKGYGLRQTDEEGILETESAIMLNLTREQMDAAWEKTAPNILDITRAFS